MESFRHYFKFELNEIVDVWFYDDNLTEIKYTGTIIDRKYYNRYLNLHPAYFVEGDNMGRWVFEHNLNASTEPVKPKIKIPGKWELKYTDHESHI